jgi:hypothetical protein
MNRGLLVVLIVLTLAAAAGVLLDSGGDDVLIPVDPDVISAPEGPELFQADADPDLVRTRTESESTTEVLASDPSAIVGQIRNSKGNPLPYAKVVFAHRQFGGTDTGWTTAAIMQVGENCDAQGRFRLPIENQFSDLVLVAGCNGYAPARQVEVAAGDVVDFRLPDLVLAPGTVFDPTGEPAASVPIEFFDPAGHKDGLPSMVVSDQDGQFELPAPGPGSYSIRVKSGAGIEFIQAGIQVHQGMDPLELRLNGELSLLAQLRDSAGLNLAGASLELFLNKAPRPFKLSSQADGAFRAYGLNSGHWRGIVHHDGYADLAVEFDYAIGGTLNFDWTLRRSGSVQVLTTSGKGRPMEGTLVRLIPDPAGSDSRLKVPEIPTNDQGLAVFENIPPGRFVVTPEALAGINPGAMFEGGNEDNAGQGKAAFSQLIEVQEGQQNQVTLVLKRHGFLVLKVTRDGQPMVGARGEIQIRSGPRGRSFEALDLSDLEGHLTFPATWMGEYPVEVQGSPAELPIVRSIDFGRGRNLREISLPNGKISGRMQIGVDPMVGAKVWAARAGEPLKELSRTDQFGKFEIVGLEEGTYHLKIQAKGYTAWEQLALEHDGGSLDLGILRLEQSYQMRGQVKGLTASPNALFGPVITIFNGQNKAVASRALGPDGVFLVADLGAGDYTVRVFQGGAELLSQAVLMPLSGPPLVLQIP